MTKSNPISRNFIFKLLLRLKLKGNWKRLFQFWAFILCKKKSWPLSTRDDKFDKITQSVNWYSDLLFKQYFSLLQKVCCCWLLGRKFHFVPSPKDRLPWLQCPVPGNFCSLFASSPRIVLQRICCLQYSQQKSHELENVHKIPQCQFRNQVDLKGKISFKVISRLLTYDEPQLG